MNSETPVLRVEGLVKHFGGRGRTRDGAVRAVDGVSLQVAAGETLGIVGESGCGKSTLARCIAQLIRADAGTIEFLGRDITRLSARGLRHVRRQVAMVFQDPIGSLNPRARIGSIIAEPIEVHLNLSTAERRKRVHELLELVGLKSEHFNRFPHEFSGGQRQRIGIARALALSPKLLICDEPVSALDVSVQAQILNLLADLQSELDLTYVFIAHNLEVVRHICDRTSVMYLGQIVEEGTTRSFYENPRHPYSAALISAAPLADPSASRARRPIILTGDVPSPVNPPSGCRFHPRCPRAAEICAEQRPTLYGPPRPGAACHFPVEKWPLDDPEDLARRERRPPPVRVAESAHDRQT